MRKIVVLTSGLIRFHVEGDRYVASTSPDGTMSVEVIASGTVASFPDVHAVWFDDSAQLIPPSE